MPCCKYVNLYKTKDINFTMFNLKNESMKKLSKISLRKLEKESLLDLEMRCLKGGFDDCTCGCHYANKGGSDTGHNDADNFAKHLHSYGGGSQSCACTLGSDHVKVSSFMIDGY